MKKSMKLTAALGTLYLLATMPRIKDKPDYSPLMGKYYAHRGLHDNGGDAPENSMAAFLRAVEAGYGIELDVQLTKDRIPVVFHDETLWRVCKVNGNVRDYTYEELQQFSLFQSQENIPLFADVLNMVNGRVPLIIEIKIHEEANTVCSITDQLISRYQGPYCIESFHPMAVAWYRKHRPEVIRGQLSSCFSKEGEPEPWEKRLVHYLLSNFVTQPDFIAYDHRFKNNLSRRICRHLYKSLSVAWTIKSQEELNACKDDFDLFIFERFEPEEKSEEV